jgi:hypothetical protein
VHSTQDEPEEIEGRFWDPDDQGRSVRGKVVWQGRMPRLLLEEPLRPQPHEGNPLERIQAMGRETADVIAGQSFGGGTALLGGLLRDADGRSEGRAPSGLERRPSVHRC